MKAGIANTVVGLLLIAFTLPSFYAIGLWLGTNITLSTSTAETLRSGNKKAEANFNNNDNHQTITDESCLRPRSNSNAMTKSPLRPPCTFKECISYF